jgi:hypothetical protein
MTSANPLPWRTSSLSSDGENCVEIAPAPDGVAMRHSKHPLAGTILFTFPAWAAFLHEALGDTSDPNGTVAITRAGTDTLVRSPDTGVELRFDAGEWSAFLAGAADGEFGFTGQPAAVG